MHKGFAWFLCLLMTGCSDTIMVFTHPPGGDLIIDDVPYGEVPKEGKAVPVSWWTFDPPRVRVTWDRNEVYEGYVNVGLGEPNHPEYLVADGILTFFLIIPGAVAFLFNGVGPNPAQHFYAPSR